MNKLDDMTFSYDAAYAAMCCWEEIASPVLKDAGGVPQPLARDPKKASGDLTERKSA